jgi:hypothetical protein
MPLTRPVPPGLHALSQALLAARWPLALRSLPRDQPNHRDHPWRSAQPQRSPLEAQGKGQVRVRKGPGQGQGKGQVWVRERVRSGSGKGSGQGRGKGQVRLGERCACARWPAAPLCYNIAARSRYLVITPTASWPYLALPGYHPYRLLALPSVTWLSPLQALGPA